MPLLLRGVLAASVLSWVALGVPAGAQGPSHCPMHGGGGHHSRGGGRAPAAGGPAATNDHAADMEVLHFLLDQGSRIRRTVNVRENGVETLTESDEPAIADKIRVHVASMYDRVKEGRRIHQRDPLFRAVFDHADMITFTTEPTEKGVRVIQTSQDPSVAALIKAHAEVVSKFIANGRREAMTDHAVPTPAK
jgi:hypothetical protein